MAFKASLPHQKSKRAATPILHRYASSIGGEHGQYDAHECQLVAILEKNQASPTLYNDLCLGYFNLQ